MKPKEKRQTEAEHSEMVRLRLGVPAMRRFRDREEYDEHDDQSDIEAHERTTGYPWSEP